MDNRGALSEIATFYSATCILFYPRDATRNASEGISHHRVSVRAGERSSISTNRKSPRRFPM